MSEAETVRTAIATALTTAFTGLGVQQEMVNTLESFQAVILRLPAVGIAYTARKPDPAPKTVGSKLQNSTREWTVFYAAAGPYVGLTAGTDVLSLLEAGWTALAGLSVTVGSLHRILRAAGEDLLVEKLPAGGLLYAQRWTYWQQG